MHTHSAYARMKFLIEGDGIRHKDTKIYIYIIYRFNYNMDVDEM